MILPNGEEFILRIKDIDRTDELVGKIIKIELPKEDWLNINDFHCPYENDCEWAGNDMIRRCIGYFIRDGIQGCITEQIVDTTSVFKNNGLKNGELAWHLYSSTRKYNAKE